MDTVEVVKLTDQERLKVAWKQLGIFGKTFAIIVLLLPAVPFIKIPELKEEEMAVAAPMVKRVMSTATPTPNAQPTLASKVKSTNANVKKVSKKPAGAIAITPTPTNKAQQSTSSPNSNQTSSSEQNNNTPTPTTAISPTPAIEQETPTPTPTIVEDTPMPTPNPTDAPKNPEDGSVGDLLANVGELKLVPILP